MPTQEDWREKVLQFEKLGYSSLFIPDHFGTFEPQWEPIATMAAIAAITEKLNVGTSVLSIDYRHPAVIAHASATIQMISNGRHELGLGAGWLKEEYRQLGISYDSGKVRYERFKEALEIITRMWGEEPTTLDGKYYKISGLPKSTPLKPGERPRLLFGGAGKSMMRLGGKYADIVNITRGSKETHKDATINGLKKKIEYIKKGAISVDRSLDDIELSIWIPRVIITDDREKELRSLSDSSGISIDDLSNSFMFLAGSVEEIRETLMNYVDIGFTYFLHAGRSFEEIEVFAKEVVQKLS
jgi:probable F420-dependent oxidoreductase